MNRRTGNGHRSKVVQLRAILGFGFCSLLFSFVCFFLFVYGFCVISNLDMLALATASATTKADQQSKALTASDISAMIASLLILCGLPCG